MFYWSNFLVLFIHFFLFMGCDLIQLKMYLLFINDGGRWKHAVNVGKLLESYTINLRWDVKFDLIKFRNKLS